MIRSILVGIDDDILADHAVIAGVNLAQKFSAQCEFVHVADVEPGFKDKLDARRWAATLARILANARQERLQHLQGVLVKAGADPAKLENTLHVFAGKPAATLLQQIHHTRPDLILLGGHRQRGMFDFGSTARSVMAKSPCPVWV